MTHFRNLSIRRKMTAAMMGTALLVLLVARTTFLIYENTVFREGMARNLEVLAETLARNSTATLTFKNADDATDTLHGLSADKSVEAAYLYDAGVKTKGQVFYRPRHS